MARKRGKKSKLKMVRGATHSFHKKRVKGGGRRKRYSKRA